MPPVAERETTRQGTTASQFGASVVLHVLVLGGIVFAGYSFQHDGEKWGDKEDLAGAVQATAVDSIPLPPRVQPKNDNVLASESPSEVPPPPTVKAAPPPKPADIPILDRRAKEPPKKLADRPTNDTPRVKQPPPTPTDRATSGQTAGVRIAMQAVQNRVGTSAINVTDQSFGARFGYYVRQMNQRISSEWYTQTLDANAQGRRVYLTFRIDRQGIPGDVRIVQKSGDNTLDTSAIRALSRIDTLGPLPEEYSGSYITVQYYFEPAQ